MASIGTPKYITVAQAESYASQAGFSNAIVPKGPYSPGTWTQIQTIVGIAAAESGLNINSYNPSDPYGGSFGVLQINGAHFHSGGTTQAAALDPLHAFQYAYILSNHGTNFIPWGTFTNRSYQGHIPPISPGVSGIPKDGWWTYPRIDNYGAFPDPQGNFKKPDSNVLVPYGYPVVTPVAGVISGINAPDGSIPSWGAVVTIKLDQPINSLATHLAFLHLADVTVRLGQKVQPGDLVAHAGDGNHAAGSSPASLGVALTPGNYYGFDGFQYNANADPQLNPVPFIESVKSNSPFLLNYNQSGIPGVTGANTSFIGSLTETLQNVGTKVKILPDADVVVVFDTLDIYTELISFKDIVPVSDYSNILTLTADIIGWIAIEMTVIIVRVMFIFIGAYVCFRVIDNLINISGTVSKIAGAGQQAAKLAVALG